MKKKYICYAVVSVAIVGIVMALVVKIINNKNVREEDNLNSNSVIEVSKIEEEEQILDIVSVEDLPESMCESNTITPTEIKTENENLEKAQPANEPVPISDEYYEEVEDDVNPVVTETASYTNTYCCGTEGHVCGSVAVHRLVCKLEEEGCKYCHSHSCPSFYAKDRWGNGVYDQELCPQYDIYKDLNKYCQDCGLKCGDGSNNTCIKFIEACNCPLCGEYVEGWTCHHCN